MQRFKQILIVDSSYTFLLFLLCNKYDVKDVFFIFWKNVPKSIHEKFDNKYLSDHDFGSISRDEYQVRNNFRQWIWFKYFLWKYNIRNVSVSGQDHLPISRFFINYSNLPFEEYEDGLESYNPHPDTIKNKFLKKLLKADCYPLFGNSPKVSKIYLTNPTKTVPHDILPKVEWINVKELWEVLPETKKQFIISLFGLDNIHLNPNVKTLILTRPISEEGICSEDEKISKVRDMTQKYVENDIIIKPHYREKTNYKEYFPKVHILTEKYPLELYLLMYGSQFKNIISLGACTVENFISQYYPSINYQTIEI